MRKQKITIIDYGVGNMLSIGNALQFLDYSFKVTSSPETILDSDALILPGVGAFPYAINSIDGKGLRPCLEEAILDKKIPVLGICLGMQILFESSTEHNLTRGLGWIPGKVENLVPEENFRVPHVGWSSLNIIKRGPKYFNADPSPLMYFDHSFHVKCQEKFVSSYCQIGNQKIVASVQRENIYGTQFHPEKSNRTGLKLLRSFIKNALRGQE